MGCSRICVVGFTSCAALLWSSSGLGQIVGVIGGISLYILGIYKSSQANSLPSMKSAISWKKVGTGLLISAIPIVGGLIAIYYIMMRNKKDLDKSST